MTATSSKPSLWGVEPDRSAAFQLVVCTTDGLEQLSGVPHPPLPQRLTKKVLRP
ncbi:MAG: hypothetical protein JRN59_03575 [Nitrososphaerota archaeon]|nr:hypothetical protein [Nitrososphaerota archaeon]